jgi:hypothetical protein
MQRLIFGGASSHETEVGTMKTLSTISAAALLAATFAIPAWAAPVGMGRTAPAAQANTAQTQVNPELVAKLQEASQEAALAGRHSGIKNNPGNPAYLKKSAQINDLIEWLKSGQKVDPSEIDQAFEPVRLW